MYLKTVNQPVFVICLIFAFLLTGKVVHAETTATLTVVNISTPATTADFEYNIAFQNHSVAPNSSLTQQHNPGNYYIFQNGGAPQGYTLTMDCGGHPFTQFGNNGVQLDLAAGDDVTCTFTNIDQSGTIEIVTTSNPAGQTNFVYDVVPASGNFQSFTQNDGETRTFSGLAANSSYFIYQAIKPGTMLAISCTGATTVPAGNNGVEIQLQPTEHAICSFDNTDNGGAITINTTSNDAGTFQYFSNDGIFFHDAGQSTTFSDLLPGSYIFGQEIAAGYTLTVTCNGAAATPLDERTVRIDLPVNGSVSCTFANTFTQTGPPSCNEQTATIYVNSSGIIVGGLDDGQPYAGVLRGTNSADVIVGTAAADHILGGNQNDLICAGAGDDLVEGENGQDTLFGEAGNDTLLGGNGKDYLDGGVGTDQLDGGNGKNTLVNGE